MKILFYGGREHTDYGTIYNGLGNALKSSEDGIVICHTGGGGLEALATSWAGIKKVECELIPPPIFEGNVTLFGEARCSYYIEKCNPDLIIITQDKLGEMMAKVAKDYDIIVRKV